jgi:hypothetical protein
MWNSQSRVTKDGTRYTIDDLEGLINIIGVELDTGDEPLEEYPKDGLCEIHYSGYLSGITNGEYIYGVYEVLKDLLSDYPCSVAPLYKEAILCSLYDQWHELFIDKIKEGTADESDMNEVWRLYVVARSNVKEPLWTNDNGQEIPPPKLEALKLDDWDLIFEMIYEEFFWDRDWDIFKNFSLEEPQPYWPSFQEYRRAVKWIDHVFSQTPTNRQADKRKAGFLVVDPILKG